MKQFPITHTANSAIAVLTDPVNMKLKIFPEKGEVYDEETERAVGPSEKVSMLKKKYYRFEDRVEHFCNILEKMVEHQVELTSRSGISMKFRARKHLIGWEFSELTKGRDPIYPRIATLKSFGKGWVDFTRAIQAITLVGRGFGDLIQPKLDNSSCTRWRGLPKGEYYLAALVSDLKEIMESDGDQHANPMKLHEDLLWYNPAKVFDPCKCRLYVYICLRTEAV
jgi:hypothetical protein